MSYDIALIKLGAPVDQSTLWQDPVSVVTGSLKHLFTFHPAQSKEAFQDSYGNHTCIILPYICAFIHTVVLYIYT